MNFFRFRHEILNVLVALRKMRQDEQVRVRIRRDACGLRGGQMSVRDRFGGFRLQIGRFADEHVNVFGEPEGVRAQTRVHHESKALTAFFDAALIDRDRFAVDLDLAFRFQFSGIAPANSEFFEPFGQKRHRVVFLDAIAPGFGGMFELVRFDRVIRAATNDAFFRDRNFFDFCRVVIDRRIRQVFEYFSPLAG